MGERKFSKIFLLQKENVRKCFCNTNFSEEY